MPGSDFLERISDAEKRVGPNLEHMLGQGLTQPFNTSNSSSRKLMYQIHSQQRLQVLKGEKAIIETGYEIRFSDQSSSITKTDSDYRIVAKISKFDFSPNHHFYLIVEDIHNKRLDMIERISYHHVTESYGYLYNNSYLDSLQPGVIIPKNTIVQKSLVFDEYNNRTDGVNFNVAYMSLDANMEDSVIFSDVAASRMTSPLIKPVKIMINENDIPLNLYGTDDMYKCIPDIGEDIKDSVLIALRKEKKEESLYNQSVERLKHVTMSDEKYTLSGKVIDVNIYCNNAENLNGYYNGQFKMYYDQSMRMNSQIVSVVTQYTANGYTLSYELQKLFANAKRILNKDQYIDKRLFSNIILEVVALEELKLKPGDKTCNRFGSKGVVSSIRPQHLMPKFGDNEYVDIILNSNGIYGRENPGQLFELEITHIGQELLYRIKNGEYDIDESFDLITKYVEFVSPDEANAIRGMVAVMSQEEKRFFLESIIMDGAINITAKPISDKFSIDKLKEMYEAFPWVNQVEIEVPIKDSTGNYRYIKARRPIIVGKQYTFRLKQYAEEKFSTTNLSATNIKNENTKSKANRDYRELYSNTPIRFGNMESNDLAHLGSGYVIVNLLIHSLSPHARRLTEQMFVCNPFKIDIRLDDDSSNRSAEIANTYLKTIGRRLIFTKRKKVRHKITISPVYSTKPQAISPIFVNKEKNFDWDKDWEERLKLEERKAKDKNIKPVIDRYGLVDEDRRVKQFEEEQKYDYETWAEKVRQKKIKELLT